MKLGSILQVETGTGRTVTTGEQTVTLLAQRIQVRLPLLAVIWTRPVGVVIRRPGKTERRPIFNANRLLFFILCGLAVAVMLLAWVTGQLLDALAAALARH
jgi:hypothetical protein